MLEMDPTITETFCELIEAGNYIATCLRIVKITRHTYNRWMRLGAEGVDPYRTFYDRILEAEAVCEANLVEQWTKAGKTDWRAIQNLLSRRFPERWREVKESHIDVEVGGEVKIVLPHNNRDNLSTVRTVDDDAPDPEMPALGAGEGYDDTGEDSEGDEVEGEYTFIEGLEE